MRGVLEVSLVYQGDCTDHIMSIGRGKRPVAEAVAHTLPKNVRRDWSSMWVEEQIARHDSGHLRLSVAGRVEASHVDGNSPGKGHAGQFDVPGIEGPARFVSKKALLDGDNFHVMGRSRLLHHRKKLILHLPQEGNLSGVE